MAVGDGRRGSVTLSSDIHYMMKHGSPTVLLACNISVAMVPKSLDPGRACRAGPCTNVSANGYCFPKDHPIAKRW